MELLALPISARRQIRLAVVEALHSRLPGVTIASPDTWPTPPGQLPALLVTTSTDSKQSINKGLAEFTTTISVVVQGQFAAATAEAAQDAIEELAYHVENAILCGYWITRMVEQFASVVTEIEITAEGSRHLGGFRMTLNAETFESFDPAVEPPAASAWPLPDPVTVVLRQLGLHADLVNVYDASGTYANPPFAEAVKPVPRTSGPDGRDEGALDIPLQP